MRVKVNGKTHEFHGDPNTPLLWYLRDELGLTGTKFGCGAALCGACTVHRDGAAIRSCVTPVVSLGDAEIVTIEGLDTDVEHPVQQAWMELGVPQCGYCQPGQIMQAAALLAQTTDPSDDEIDQAMNGNICRCCTYTRIRSAIRLVKERKP